MQKYKASKLKIVLSITIISTLLFTPHRVSGEVAPIAETQEKLENISQEEMDVLEDLYAIAQEIEVQEQEKNQINNEIYDLQEQITNLEDGIIEKQKDYDTKLDVLEQVLVYYQRGGPASYLEILLSAESFTEFLKSINVLKDISRNVSELLTTIEDGKKALKEEKQLRDQQMVLLEDKKKELEENLHKSELLRQEQEQYLVSLQENRVYYEEQLQNLKLLWEDSRALFTDIVAEITRIIGEGYVGAEDLNLELGLFTMQGAIEEETFNNILKENSELSDITFHFKEGEVVIEVPERHLVLYGDFVISGDSAIKYEVTSGTFYELPLDEVSIAELFEKGPLLIDFATIAGDTVMVDFTLKQVESEDTRLAFEIKLEW